MRCTFPTWVQVLAYVAANKSLYTDSPVDTAIIYRVLVDNLVCTLLIKFGILTAGHAGILIKVTA